MGFEFYVKMELLMIAQVFPASRAHGGIPKYKQAIPSKLLINGQELKEFPINTTRAFTKKWIFSGGGYFRLSPYSLIKSWSKIQA